MNHLLVSLQIEHGGKTTLTNLAVVCTLPVSPVLVNKHETKDDLQTADSNDDAHALDSPDADAHDLFGGIVPDD